MKRTGKAEMSWKKGAISYLTWFVYTLAAGGAMACAAGAFCDRAGIGAYWGVLFAAVLFLAVGNLVSLIRRHAQGLAGFAQRNKGLLRVLEAAAVAALLAVGIALRAQGLEGAPRSSVYFEAAKVAEGQRIPQMVHGAVYYYVQMLHVLFLLVGNHFEAGLWLQIALQLLASLILFFGVRRLAGSAGALTALFFCTCSSYMVENALGLSPANFLFFVLAAAVCLMTIGGRSKLNPPWFFLAGIPIAFCCYIDIAGVVLLFFALASVFSVRRERSGRARRMAAVLLCLGGTGVAFFMMAYVDALASGKELGGVLQAWWLLYRPEGFRVPVSIAADAGVESLLLAGLMIFGVFGFWCHKKEERMSVWVLAGIGMGAAECCGIFTEELPGAFFLYLLVVVLAGIGFGQCFGASCVQSGNLGGDGVTAEAEVLEASRTMGAQGGILSADHGGQGLAEAEAGTAVPEARALAEGDCMTKQETLPGRESKAEGGRQIHYIENPLPLPKKHEKRVLDFPSRPGDDEDDFDYPVSDEDDFDL